MQLALATPSIHCPLIESLGSAHTTLAFQAVLNDADCSLSLLSLRACIMHSTRPMCTDSSSNLSALNTAHSHSSSVSTQSLVSLALHTSQARCTPATGDAPMPVVMLVAVVIPMAAGSTRPPPATTHTHASGARQGRCTLPAHRMSPLYPHHTRIPGCSQRY